MSLGVWCSDEPEVIEKPGYVLLLLLGVNEKTFTRSPLVILKAPVVYIGFNRHFLDLLKRAPKPTAAPKRKALAPPSSEVD